MTTYLEHFVRRAHPAPEARLEQLPTGDRWRLSLPAPIVVVVEFTAREIAASRNEPQAFLREADARIRAALASSEQRWADGAEVAKLKARIRALEDERSE